MLPHQNICAGCGANLSSARELGSSGIYDPDGPDFDLCMPCWNGEEALVEESGTNFQPKLLDRYYATFEGARPKLYERPQGRVGMKATAIIDLAFGDSGKGQMTSYFAARTPGGLVVRHSGGAQAGHTVQTQDGSRHIFSHFGAGTFAGLPTFLSRFFIVNPFVWIRERGELNGRDTPLFISRAAPLTTPFDMMINQEAERCRGDKRHGSCGLGINETIHRLASGFSTRAHMLVHPGILKERLYDIRDDYVPARLNELGITPSEETKILLRDHSVIESYLNLCQTMRHGVSLCNDDFLKGRDGLIFEGAQGLLLDEDHCFFPHVTRSKTGLTNVATLCQEAGINSVDAVYVTRTYMTRHGAGPFPTEDASLSFEDITNKPHEFQGSLRFGHLDLDLMREAIAKDLASVRGEIHVNPMLAVTHIDQMPGSGKLKMDGILGTWDIDDMIDKIFWRLCIDDGYLSYGPTRSDVYDRIRRGSMRVA